MARGVPPRGAGGAGRSQPPRRTTGGQRGGAAKATGRTVGKATQTQRSQAQLQRTQLVQQQRQAAAQTAARQQQQRQLQAIRDAHAHGRRQEAQRRTAELRQQVDQLESILATGLRRSARIDLETLVRPFPEPEPFDPGPLATPLPEPVWEEFDPDRGMAGNLASRIGGQSRRQRRQEAARAEFEAARQQWQAAQQQRQEQLAAARAAHEEAQAARRREVEAYHDRIARVKAGLAEREPAAVESFLRTVLRRVPLPADFPRRYEVTHDPATERVTVRMVLPDRSIVPAATGYEYRTTVDKLVPVPRPADQAAALYTRVLAQVVLLVLRDVYEAEPVLARVAVHGLLDRVDPGTGQPEFACLVRVDTDRAGFAPLPLAEQAPERLLGELDAELSPDPYAGQPLP